MEEVKTRGVIIFREDQGEYDRRLVVMTLDLGKLRLAARGVRRPKAKLASHLELFNLVELRIVGKTIIGARVIDSFPKLRENVESLEQAFLVSELFLEFVYPEAKDGDLFQLLVDCFRNSDFKGFQARFIGILGFGGAKPKNLKIFLRNRLE
jgi:DNA repair protein RecO (recombination protein O)